MKVSFLHAVDDGPVLALVAAGVGADVELMLVPLKYQGLAPWEIWLSEAQERMVLAAPRENLPKLQEICELFDVELTDIGEFRDTGRLEVHYAGNKVLDLANYFLHDGIPQRRLDASIRPTQEAPSTRGTPARELNPAIV